MRSMTGCGRSQRMDGAWEITVELKAVNHRFLDLSLRLPRNLSFLEGTIRQTLTAGMKRGHVDVFVTVRRIGASAQQVVVDEAMALAYANAARQLAEATKWRLDDKVTRLMEMEGVIRLDEPDMDEEAVTALCREATGEALRQLDDMRVREGENLRRDLAEHLNQAEGLKESIAQRAPLVVEEYRARLQLRLKQMRAEAIEPQRLAQEVALMADRCAIDEELSRLDSHIGQMRRYFDAPGETGKKMDFLIQEMNREANTIGSKASDAAIAQWVVDLKSEIEKLREQVQNVE